MNVFYVYAHRSLATDKRSRLGNLSIRLVRCCVRRIRRTTSFTRSSDTSDGKLPPSPYTRLPTTWIAWCPLLAWWVDDYGVLSPSTSEFQPVTSKAFPLLRLGCLFHTPGERNLRGTNCTADFLSRLSVFPPVCIEIGTPTHPSPHVTTKRTDDRQRLWGDDCSPRSIASHYRGETSRSMKMRHRYSTSTRQPKEMRR